MSIKTEKRTKKEKIKTIIISGRRWFDKTYGNTYCSSRVYLNGQYVFSVSWRYGYGNFYEQAAREELIKRGLVKLKENESFFTYCERNKIVYEAYAIDGLKRDMVIWGTQCD